MTLPHALEETLSQMPSQPSLRILLAEDNLVNGKIATRMLLRLGYQADTVINGREAIEALQMKVYDIVLMDLHMPDMDGITATRWILSHPKDLVYCPMIIALTANTLPEDRQRCEDSGMVDFIAKPFGMETLARVLERWTKIAA